MEQYKPKDSGYQYRPVWQETHINSEDFHEKQETQNPKPEDWPAESDTFHNP